MPIINYKVCPYAPTKLVYTGLMCRFVETSMPQVHLWHRGFNNQTLLEVHIPKSRHGRSQSLLLRKSTYYI